MKRVFRSNDNKIFAGVMGGLGEYFGVDPVFVRLVWLLVLICTGIIPGLIVYILAVFVVPKHPEHREHTTAHHDHNHEHHSHS